jgi:hypothetical protein
LPTPDRRRVVLDADIPWKLAHELRKRGRLDATALRLDGVEDRKDGALFKALAADYEPCVLVTFDNKMRFAHAAELEHFGITLAVINSKGLADWHGADVTYIRNGVHRWLHLIEVQKPVTTVLYTAATITRTPAR